jgi:hypothetical protein
LSKGDKSQQHKVAEVSEHFSVWGYGSLARPDRLDASVVIELVLSELLPRYHLRLENPMALTLWSWEIFTLPFEGARVIRKKLLIERGCKYKSACFTPCAFVSMTYRSYHRAKILYIYTHNWKLTMAMKVMGGAGVPHFFIHKP